ncbi:MAG: EamA family transporter [Candidatus Polarisedimenticolia bacterium]
MTGLASLLALLSSITYGTADFLGGLAARRHTSVIAVVIVSQAAGLVLLIVMLPLLPTASPVARDFLWGAAGGLAGSMGLALLYRGLAIGVMSVVAPITAVCSLIFPLAAGLMLGERPAPKAVLGVLLAVVAIVLISRTGEDEDGKRATAGVGVAIASGIAIGVFLVCLQRTGPEAGLWPLVPARVVSVSLCLLAGMIRREALVPRRSAMPLVVGAGALDMAANVLYLVAVRKGPLGLVATLVSLYPASTILLARMVLGERLRLVQHAGVACATVAIVLIVAG